MKRIVTVTVERVRRVVLRQTRETWPGPESTGLDRHDRAPQPTSSTKEEEKGEAAS
ncbi:MAG: hypothetical protein ABI779_27935 [Acidobacteriota bacterium]